MLAVSTRTGLVAYAYECTPAADAAACITTYIHICWCCRPKPMAETGKVMPFSDDVDEEEVKTQPESGRGVSPSPRGWALPSDDSDGQVRPVTRVTRSAHGSLTCRVCRSRLLPTDVRACCRSMRPS